MMRYRYCTPALAGTWRDTPGEALDDAVRAGQARIDASGRQIEMLIGRIERMDGATVDGSELRSAA
jgi:hypothetical protein